MDYQGNSKKSREASPDKPPKVVERVIINDVIIKKKGPGQKFHDLFIEANFKTVVKLVAANVLLPAAKGMMMDSLTKGGAYLFYGDRGRDRYNPGPRIQYGGQVNRSYSPAPLSRESTMQYAPTPSPAPRQLQQHSRDALVLSDRADADIVLERMTDIIDTHGAVSLADLQDLLGQPAGPHTDNKWGWTNLANVSIRQIREGYLIDLPPADPIA